ncbi:unnamed protein product [Hymenolepis diminuta]|uniref:Ovule protein n=1 Tax=Hymenolepis diminuta TaxID=6216 RepID=A0A0R3SPK5_HYMDI|nr:unnamed protein product [Hymenolepis diminuta]
MEMDLKDEPFSSEYISILSLFLSKTIFIDRKGLRLVSLVQSVLRITTRPADNYASCSADFLARDTARCSLSYAALSFSLSLALSRCYALLFPRIHLWSTRP